MSRSSSRKPKVLVLRTAGTNCDKETAFAFALAGARPLTQHINQFITKRKILAEYDILAIPGGFSYGDDLAAGKILANELKYRLGEELSAFLASGKLVIGICNGFQVLVKAGILPGNLNKRPKSKGNPEQLATLSGNDSNKFEDRWVNLKPEKSRCIWTQGLKEAFCLPVAHGEGKFISKEKWVLGAIRNNNQVVLRYANSDARIASVDYPQNPNGSEDNIAGICDPTGRIFGLMPHPERHIWKMQSPASVSYACGFENAPGLEIFINGVSYAKKHL
jgi:phosphoribosylformylglycinamidine synthase